MTNIGHYTINKLIAHCRAKYSVPVIGLLFLLFSFFEPLFLSIYLSLPWFSFVFFLFSSSVAHIHTQIGSATAAAAIQSTRKPAANLFGILWHFNILCGKRINTWCVPFCPLFRFWSKVDSVNIKLCIICLHTRTHALTARYFPVNVNELPKSNACILQCNNFGCYIYFWLVWITITTQTCIRMESMSEEWTIFTNLFNLLFRRLQYICTFRAIICVHKSETTQYVAISTVMSMAF